jgi:hypothetical protein
MNVHDSIDEFTFNYMYVTLAQTVYFPAGVLARTLKCGYRGFSPVSMIIMRG